MSVILVELSSQGASGSASGRSGGLVRETYTATFRVECDNALDGPQVVLTHFKQTASLPYMGRRYDYGNDRASQSVCSRLQVRHIDKSIGRFEVDAEFEPLDADGEDAGKVEQGTSTSGKLTEDPEEWRYSISSDFYTLAKPVEKAIFREGVNAEKLSSFLVAGSELPPMNSSGVPFDPPVEDEDYILVLRITRWVQAYDEQLEDDFTGAVNTDEFVINLPAYRFFRRVRKNIAIAKVNHELENINGQVWWRRNFELAINPNGWRRVLLDRGLVELLVPGDVRPDGTVVDQQDFDPSKPFEHVPITDLEGNPVSSPVLLDGRGKALDPTKKPVYLIYSTKREVAFAPLAGRAW